MVASSAKKQVPGGAPDMYGIECRSGHALRVDGVSVHGFSGAAVLVEPTADGGPVNVTGSDLRDNCTAGVLARRSAGRVAATVTDSFLSSNGTAILAGAGSDVIMTRSPPTRRASRRRPAAC